MEQRRKCHDARYESLILKEKTGFLQGTTSNRIYHLNANLGPPDKARTYYHCNSREALYVLVNHYSVLMQWLKQTLKRMKLEKQYVQNPVIHDGIIIK